MDELVSYYLKPDDEQKSDVVVVEKAYTRLRGIPAIHYVVHFSDPKSGLAMISDNIAAIRRGYFVYEIGLTTVASRYLEEKPVLEQVIKGWKLLPFYE